MIQLSAFFNKNAPIYYPIFLKKYILFDASENNSGIKEVDYDHEQ